MEPGALVWAVFGVSVTGFFFLAGWIRKISDDNILRELKEIKLALVGDMDKPGIITRLHEHDRDNKNIKVFCRETHDVPRNA